MARQLQPSDVMQRSDRLYIVMADLGVNNVGIQYSGVVLGVVSTPKSAKMKNISLEKAR